MRIIAIYETDTHHTRASRNTIALATTEAQRDKIIKRYLKEYPAEKIPADKITEAIGQIRTMGQTRGLDRDWEIDTEELNVNQIIYD